MIRQRDVGCIHIVYIQTIIYYIIALYTYTLSTIHNPDITEAYSQSDLFLRTAEMCAPCHMPPGFVPCAVFAVYSALGLGLGFVLACAALLSFYLPCESRVAYLYLFPSHIPIPSDPNTNHSTSRPKFAGQIDGSARSVSARTKSGERRDFWRWRGSCSCRLLHAAYFVTHRVPGWS